MPGKSSRARCTKRLIQHTDVARQGKKKLIWRVMVRISSPGLSRSAQCHFAENSMASSKKINVAIIGLGFGAEFIPIYRNHPNANMYAVCQRNTEKLKKVGDEFKIEKRFTSYDDV